MNRRNFIKTAGILPFIGININEILAKEDNSDKSCIFVYLHGGISQVETFSPLSDMPAEFRSMTGAIKTNIGTEIGGTFPTLARYADKFNIVRSFSHNDANHNSAQHWVTTSHPSFQVLDGSPQKEPCYGSIVSALKGANTEEGLPSYVKLNKLTYDKSAWLGAEHLGYEPNGELEPKVSIEKFNERLKIVNEIENAKENNTRNQYLSKSWTSLRNQAAKVIAGNVSTAFKIDGEKQETIDKYRADKSEFCKNMLISRRLIERGCKFVSVVNGGWDMHSDLFNGFTNLSKDVDHGLAMLIEDLYDRGLSKDCMVIITSEFGRTSKINVTAGRDHQPGITPLLISGGNFEQGRIIGSHDNKATQPTSTPLTPFDLLATIFSHFGFDNHIQKIDNGGRPRYLLEKGNCIL